MLYREIITVCSEIHTKHINTLCGQNVELLNVKLVVHILTAGLIGRVLNPGSPDYEAAVLTATPPPRFAERLLRESYTYVHLS